MMARGLGASLALAAYEDLPATGAENAILGSLNASASNFETDQAFVICLERHYALVEEFVEGS